MKYFKKTKSTIFIFGILVVAALTISACSSVPKTKYDKTSLEADSAQALSQAKEKDPSLVYELKNSSGYAVFPTISKGAVGVGGAFGQGIVYKNDKQIGFTSLRQATIGFQLGGQTYSEILIFSNNQALKNFKKGNLAFSAQATATALKSGAAADAKYAHGVAVLTLGHQGLMYEASVGGQKFSYKSK